MFFVPSDKKLACVLVTEMTTVNSKLQRLVEVCAYENVSFNLLDYELMLKNRRFGLHS